MFSPATHILASVKFERMGFFSNISSHVACSNAVERFYSTLLKYDALKTGPVPTDPNSIKDLYLYMSKAYLDFRTHYEKMSDHQKISATFKVVSIGQKVSVTQVIGQMSQFREIFEQEEGFALP